MRYRQCALKQAYEMVIFTKKAAGASGKKSRIPVFTGDPVLDSRFITIEDGVKSFDLAIKLSTLTKGTRITLLSKKTRPYNKWSSFPGSQLVQGCRLSVDHITLSFDIPEPSHKEGKILGIDLGINKLVSLSDGIHLGTGFKKIRNKILKKRPGSKAHARARAERTNYINHTMNQIPWTELGTIGVEDLHDMKRGKRRNRGKSFRKAMAPWTYRQCIQRIEMKAQENRVRLVRVDPRHTSQMCPQCKVVHKENRRGENYGCACGYSGDADTVGAINVFFRTLETTGSVESPVLQRRAVDYTHQISDYKA